MFRLWPWPGAQLVIAAAAPTAVNVMVLTKELEGDAPAAAHCVFWTTLASAATVTLVLALIEGPTLADRIAAGLIPVDEALAIAKQIIEALEYAHERGVVTSYGSVWRIVREAGITFKKRR